VGGGTRVTTITTDSGNLQMKSPVTGTGVTLVTTTSGNVALNANVNAGAGTATLSSAGNINQTGGTLTGATLTGSAATSVNLPTATGRASCRGAVTSTGGVTLDDSGGVTGTGAGSDSTRRVC